MEALPDTNGPLSPAMGATADVPRPGREPKPEPNPHIPHTQPRSLHSGDKGHEYDFADFGVKWKPRIVGGRWDPIGRPLFRGCSNTVICGAVCRTSGKPCMRQALANVNGEWGRCRIHGGQHSKRALALREAGIAASPKTAIRRLAERMEELSQDEELASIEKQVALAAATLHEYIETHLQGKDILDEKELDKLMSYAERLTKMTERRHKIREGVKVNMTYIDNLAQLVIVVVSGALKDVLGPHPSLYQAVYDRIVQGLQSAKLMEQEGLRR